MTSSAPPEPIVIWRPQPRADGTPGPQQQLLECPIEDIFFGGARGGGKSDGLLGDFLQQARQYKRAARGIIFRKTYNELEELQRRAGEIYSAIGGVYQVGPRTWVLPGGATLKMRYLERIPDADKYQGHQYTWEGFDEAGNWPTSEAIDKLAAAMRSAEGVPCVRRLSGNPGGVGHQWLKARYIDPAPPLRPHLDEKSGMYRVFIPSHLRDNLILQANDPRYEQRVRASGPPWLVKAWLEGDWNAMPDGGFFRIGKIVESADVPKLDRFYQAWDVAVSEDDFADNAYSACATMGVDSVGRYWLVDIQRGRWNSSDLINKIIDHYRKYKAARVWIEGGVIGKTLKPFLEKRQNETVRVPIEWVQPVHDKVARAAPIAAIIDGGFLYVPKGAGWLRDLYNELCVFPQEGHFKDQVDALAWCGMKIQSIRPSSAPPSSSQPDTVMRGAELDHFVDQVDVEKGTKRRRSGLHY